MRKSISPAIVFATIAALLCATCGDNGASSKSPENDGAVDAFAGKFNRKSGQETPTTIPRTPSGVTASAASSSSITVKWNSVTGATSYRVYRNTSSTGSYTLVGTSTSTSYTHTGLSASTTYYYKVSACNSAGESSLSSYASATTTSNTAKPAIPSDVTASAASSSSITVSWSSVTGVTGYYVYRSTSASGTYSYVTSTSSTSYTNTGLSASTTYYYKVSAYNSAGEGSQSSYAYATTTSNTTKPATPSGVTASAVSSHRVAVSWYSVSGATQYLIYYSTSSAGSYTHIGTSTSTSYTHTGLSASTTYYYKVSAYNSAGESSLSSYASATTNAVTTPVVETFTDARDNQMYRKVKIGNQTWMAENLNYDTADGTGSWCYNNADSNCVKYGRLYNWNTAMAGATSSTGNPSGVRGVCPSGWHLPSRAEWGELAIFAGGTGIYGDDLYGMAGKTLKSTSGWSNGGNGTDEYGFSALPSGDRSPNGVFNYAGYHGGGWWTATVAGTNPYYRYMTNDMSGVPEAYDNNINYGESVRCVED